jgi:uncharacterized protein involved in propanediol utilization
LSRRTGRGRSTGHHGEIIQGYFDHADASAGDCYGLVTLPYPDLISEARVHRVDQAHGVIGQTRGHSKATAAAIATLTALDAAELGVRLHISSTIPIGHGFGSSSADVVATIRAVCDLLDVAITPHELARLAVAAEVATDPLMFDEVVLFAQRVGLVIDGLGRRLPQLRVLGFHSASTASGVDTVGQPAIQYSIEERREFTRLRGQLVSAVRDGDAEGLGRVATGSTEICRRYLAVERLDAFMEIAAAVGAVGLQVAHSGDIAGLIFDGADPGVLRRIGHAKQLLLQCGVGATWLFSPDGAGGGDGTLPTAAQAGGGRPAVSSGS